MPKQKGFPISETAAASFLLRVDRALRRSGFTLVELVVVIAIVAVLATIGLLSLQGYGTDARNAATKTNVRSVSTAFGTAGSDASVSLRSFVSRSWSTYEVTGAAFSGVTLSGGTPGAFWTNYSAGKVSYSALKLDGASFDDRGNEFLAGAAEARESLPGGRFRLRSAYQVAGTVSDGGSDRAYVEGTYAKAAATDVEGLVLAINAPYPIVSGTDRVPYATSGTASPGTPPTAALASSVRFNGSTSLLSRNFGTPTNQNLWTYSAWTKLGTNAVLLSKSTGTYYEYFAIDSTGKVFWVIRNSAGTVYKQSYTPSPRFRDYSAWYHVLVRKTAPLTVEVFVNNEAVPLTNQSAGTPVDAINSSSAHEIGHEYDGSTHSYMDGYLSEAHFVDGQSLDASAFAEPDPVSGSWRPKTYAGTYGANGFHLDFGSGTALGNDVSDRSNHWTPTALTETDRMADSPTNNFATLNPMSPLNTLYAGYYAILPTSGNLKITGSASPAGNSSVGTIAITSQKTYFEGSMTAIGAGTVQFGIRNLSTNLVYVYDNSGNKILGGTSTAYGSAFTAGDLIGVAVDPNALALEFFKNGASQWTVSAAFPAGQYVPFFYASNGSSSVANFGQWGRSGLSYRPGAGGYFAYDPPSGFKALSTGNMPALAVPNARANFGAVAYTGTSANNTISGLGFTPDLLWFKNRDTSAVHALMDSSRGWNKVLSCQSPNQETSEASPITFPSVGQFTIPASYGGSWNDATNKYVVWGWKAGGSPVPNSDGSIPSQVSANPAAGFSIVSYTGNTSQTQTVGHGLGAVPKFVIIKPRVPSGTGNWNVWLDGFTSDEYLLLNSNPQKTSYVGNFWSVPTSSVFWVDSRVPAVNAASVGFVAYVWSEVPGFSKFGTYVGNGNSDGPFIHTGFKPRYFLLKNISRTGTRWTIIDSARNPSNVMKLKLSANYGGPEDGLAYWYTDFVANGIKLRDYLAGDTEYNYPGDVFMYAAFAEAPFGGQGVAPATAR